MILSKNNESLGSRESRLAVKSCKKVQNIFSEIFEDEAELFLASPALGAGGAVVLSPGFLFFNMAIAAFAADLLFILFARASAAAAAALSPPLP